MVCHSLAMLESAIGAAAPCASERTSQDRSPNVRKSKASYASVRPDRGRRTYPLSGEHHLWWAVVSVVMCGVIVCAPWTEGPRLTALVALLGAAIPVALSLCVQHGVVSSDRRVPRCR
jgi:hypothetical protein